MTDYPIISRKEAKQQGLKYYFTGIACKNGHISKRIVSDHHCCECNKSISSKYRKTNPEYIITYRDNNIEYYKRKGKEWRETNPDYPITYREANPNYTANYTKNRKTIDPLYKLSCDIRGLICNVMRNGGYKKTTKTATILGCSFEQFKIHIENQFQEGMNWNNHGEWHYDHIYPVSRAIDEEHLIQLNHYTNYQPLWAVDNLRKGNKVSD